MREGSPYIKFLRVIVGLVVWLVKDFGSKIFENLKFNWKDFQLGLINLLNWVQ